MEKVRLQKYMADCGIASRRKCEELIVKGLVKVNGQIVKELGTKINPSTDNVLYNGKVLNASTKKIYILLNKPTRICNSSKR